MKRPSETGVTIVELIMATAITGLIVGFLGTAIYQIFTVAQYGNDRLTATHELQNAAHWFNFDGQQATSATGGSGLVLTLSDNSTVAYSRVGTELRRNVSSAQMILGRNITGANFSVTNRLITMQLTSAPQGRDGISENRTYQVWLRPSEVDG